jgi:hypothetical protein
MTLIARSLAVARRGVSRILFDASIRSEAGEMSAWYEARSRRRSPEYATSDRQKD